MSRVDTEVWFSAAVLAGVIASWAMAIGRDCRRSGYRLEVYLGLRALWLFCKLWHGFRPPPRDPLPPSGRAILISNHSSPADPVFLQCTTGRVISFLMAREYYDIKFLRPVFHLNDTILVSRSGRDTAAMKATLRALGQGKVIGIFPEGGIHLDRHTLGRAKSGAALLALLTRAPVIPAFIERQWHTNSLWTGLMRPVRTRIFFGGPIDLTRYYDREHDADAVEEVTRQLMNAIERLRPSRIADCC